MTSGAVTQPTFVNLGFEDPDPAVPGQPLGWTWAHRVTSFKLATFGGSRLESFRAGWASQVFTTSLTTANSERLTFFTAGPTPEYVDTFEHNWNNDEHLTALDNALAYMFAGPAGALSVERFEYGWRGNGDYLFALTSQSLGAAMYLPQGDPVESFEAGWRSDESFVFVLGPTTTSTAMFSAAAFEGFENFKVDVPFLWDVSTQQVDAPGHGFAQGDLVTFYAAADGLSALPGGIVPTRRYRVNSPTYAGFYVQNEAGTAPVSATDSGSGSIFIKADTRSHWTTSID